jgi:YVTN family beta-propeller protein
LAGIENLPKRSAPDPVPPPSLLERRRADALPECHTYAVQVHWELVTTARQVAAMQRFRWVRGVVVLGLAGTLVGVVPVGASAAAARSRCRPTIFVANAGSGTVSTIDAKTRTKKPADIAVVPTPGRMAVTPDGKTVFVTNINSVSTIDVKTRTKNPDDVPVGTNPRGWQSRPTVRPPSLRTRAAARCRRST